MKNSTVGIGIAFLSFIAGTGLWYSIGENRAGDNSPYSSSEYQAAFAQEAGHSLPILPPPLAEPSGRLTPRHANEETKAERPGYLILGQQPQTRLTRKDTGMANPLRGGISETPASPQNLPNQHHRPAQPLPQSQAQPRHIQQTSLQGESQSDIPSGFPTDLSTLPTPPASQQESLLDAAIFPVATPQSTVPDPLSEPQPPVERGFQQFDMPAPAPIAATPLQSADPFATESEAAGSAAAVPPVVQAPVTEQKISSAKTLGAEHSPPANPFGQSEIPSPRSNNSLRSSEGKGMPGASALEGAQSAHLTVEKVLPGEVIIDQPATIILAIKNTGKSTAKNITVVDQVPQGAKLLSTSPETFPNENGELLWSLGNLDPNEQTSVEIRILPLREGEIGSVAAVNYSAEASARINVSRPMLKVDVKVPPEVRLGETVNLEITISNPGTATATGIVLVENIPDGLYHKDGKVLEHRSIGTLKPKEEKVLVLPLICTGPGNLVNHLVVKANNNLSVEDKTAIRALAPVLELGIVGPQQRFLERKATYQLVVSNSGTASAQNVDLVATLPAAVKFVSTNQSGVYERQTHTVHWALEELPSREAGEIELVVLPSQIGEHSIRFTGNGQNNLKAESVKSMTIDGLPALSFEVVGSSNLVEVGKDVVYEISVANKGTKAANNVKVQARLSEGMTFVKAEGSPSQSNGGVVAYSPLSQLEAKGEKVFKITARCNTDGDHRISVQIISDDLGSPITKEESTRVFQ